MRTVLRTGYGFDAQLPAIFLSELLTVRFAVISTFLSIMKHLKPQFSRSTPEFPQQNSVKKSGIKEIICPATYSPIWQKAFALADNVRFTRTPDCELQRRRAAIDPVYAKILADLEQAKAAQQNQAVDETEETESVERQIDTKVEARAEAGDLVSSVQISSESGETKSVEEAHLNRENPRKMYEELDHVFTPASVDEECDQVQPVLPQCSGKDDPLALVNGEAQELWQERKSEDELLFPWEKNLNDEISEQTASVAQYSCFMKVMAPALKISKEIKTALADQQPRSSSDSYSVGDITQLFRSLEYRQPQMRWVPVAGPEASDKSAAAKQGLSPAAFTTPALNLQFKVENYGAAAAEKRPFTSTPQFTVSCENACQNAEPKAKQADLNRLCSSAVEKVPFLSSAPKVQIKDEPVQMVNTQKQEQKQEVADFAAHIEVPKPQEKSAPAELSTAALAQSLPTKEAKYSYQLPSLDLLQEPRYQDVNIISQETLERSAGLLESILEDFGVKGEIIHVRPGPVVTLYEFEPAPGVKSSRVVGLAEDIARSMSAVAARVAVIPGRNVIGIELPNKKREMVYLREILQSHAYKTSDYKLPLALGKNIGGEPVIAELAKMPHLLVAGTTGSGKSVSINTMILSLLYRMPPSRCRLIMVDPKMLELSVYEGIPHLLTPVVTDPKKALSALKWAVREMEDRYRKMAKLGVRNIDGFNTRVKEAKQKGETITCTVQAGFDRETGELLYTEEAMDLTQLPYIVIIVDEMADLMMIAGKEIEGVIQRLAQMARAAGIHLIMATQRPSVDVITGTIKANFPTRMSFQVTSKIDSRTILGEQGAETLLGQGDMLQMIGGGRIKRIHGPFVSDREVEKIVAYLKTQGTPEYLATVTESTEEDTQDSKGKTESDDDQSVANIVAAASGNDDFDDLYVQAIKIVMRDKKCSTSYIQRRLSIGYNKAATLVEKMEEEGLVGEANHVGKREILINS